MRYVIAYDITSDSRRGRVAEIFAGWGDRVQYSVFEVDVSARELAALLGALEPLICPPGDRLRVWRLCRACQQATHAVGGAAVADRDVAWIL